MKIKRRHTEEAVVSTESLNDIMFFLLLFFLIISTLANPSVLKLTVPSAEKPLVDQPKPVVVEVNVDHQYVIDKTMISFTDLEDALKLEIQRTNSSIVILRFDNTLSIQDLADVMQIGYGLGAKMVLQTTSVKK